MSQSLYRKYRSQRFADLVGQQTVVRILLNSISRGRLSHAYLFCGPRGTGKTSVARIFSKAINCENPQDGDCCGVCENCLAIASGSAVDVIEMDAASNRGIDDVRELRDKIQRGPLQFKYKTYIIDEVHMISREGFNALLKTLEEPPAHAIFCLCTTEAEKLPVTIRSRCIRFDFQRLALDALAAHLQRISSAEGFSLEADAALELAGMAEGSARDAISLLDQLTVYCSQSITLPDIRTLFQLGDPRQLPELLDRLAAGETGAAIGSWDELLRAGTDPQRCLLGLAAELKQRYLASGEPGLRSALQAVWNGLNLLRLDAFPALLVELTMLEVQTALSHNPGGGPSQAPTGPAPTAAASAKAPRTQAAEAVQTPSLQQRAAAAPAEPPQSPGEAAVLGPPFAERRNTALAAATRQPDGLLSSEAWSAFCEKAARLRITSQAVLSQAMAARKEGGELLILFAAEDEKALALASSKDHLQALAQAATQLLGEEMSVRLRLAGQEEPPRQDPPVQAADSAPRPQPEASTADELDVALYDEEEAPASKGPDPAQLTSARVRMESQIESAAGKPELAGPVTAQQAMELFDAVDLTEE